MSAALSLAGIVGLLFLLAWWVSPASEYRTDRNPYRRWCNRCGQCQEFTHYAWGSNANGWWEDTGGIKNPGCACHKDADNTR